jgi:Na+-transporting NADH:ubiquinone oxidoreductase subunit NqrB
VWFVFLKAFFISNVANRWLGVRVEFIGTCVVTLAAIFAVIERHNIDPGLAGLSISYALNITGTLNWCAFFEGTFIGFAYS